MQLVCLSSCILFWNFNLISFCVMNEVHSVILASVQMMEFNDPNGYMCS